MTTDTMRQKFEQWFYDHTMGWTEEDKVLSRATWDDAYAQGQRDLIEAIKPDAYQIMQPDGRSWIYETNKLDEEYLDRMRGKGYTVRALCFSPQNTPK